MMRKTKTKMKTNTKPTTTTRTAAMKMLALVVAAVLANNDTAATTCGMTMMPFGFVEGLSSIAPHSQNMRTRVSATTAGTATTTTTTTGQNNTTNNMRLSLRDAFVEAQLLTGLAHIALETAGFAAALANNNNNNNDSNSNNPGSIAAGHQRIGQNHQYHHYLHTDNVSINRVTLEQQRLKLLAIVGRILDWPSINTGEVWIQVFLMCVAIKEFVFNNNTNNSNDNEKKWF